MSMKKGLIFSMILNIILILFICYKMGLFDFRNAHDKAVDRRNTSEFYYTHSPMYSDRKSIFEIIPRDSGQIVFLGDSHIDWCEWSELLSNKKIVNRGIGGDNAEGVLKRLDIITASHPDKIFLKIGNNDIFFGFSVEEIISNYRSILISIKEKSPTTKTFLISCPPNLNFEKVPNSEIAKLNTKIKKLAKELNLTYIDVHSKLLDKSGNLDKKYTNDNIHLNGQGYLVWKAEIIKFIN